MATDNSEFYGRYDKAVENHKSLQAHVFRTTMEIQNLTDQIKVLIDVETSAESLKKIENLVKEIESKALYLKGYGG